MLAERRKKTFYSNPRGTLWANDKEKFGQKLLSKMGWQEGQGLGRNSDGMKESLKANFKFDNRGLGFQQKSNPWIEDNNIYEQILADLAQHHHQNEQQEKHIQISEDVASTLEKERDSDKCENIGKLYNTDSNTFDLVQKSKVNGRLHYRHKFIKAKNLSMKSQSDLDCIFGKRASSNFDTSNKLAETTIKKIKISEDDREEENEEETRKRRKQEKKERKLKRRLKRQESGSGDDNEKDREDKKNKEDTRDEFFQTIQSKLSVQDYFKQKMDTLRAKKLSVFDQNSTRNNFSPSRAQDMPKEKNKEKYKGKILSSEK